MADTLTRDTLFKPNRSKAETKADITDRTARGIMDSEAAKREAKTERLRAARLAAEEAAPAPVAAPTRRKAAAKKK